MVLRMKYPVASPSVSKRGSHMLSSEEMVPDQNCERTITKMNTGMNRQSCSMRNCSSALSSSIPLRSAALLFPSIRAAIPTKTLSMMICDVLPSANALTMFVGKRSRIIFTTSPMKSPPPWAPSDGREKKGMQIRQAKAVDRALSDKKRPTSVFPARPSVATSPMPQTPHATVKKIRGPERPLSIAM